jgi:hypothetical protein
MLGLPPDAEADQWEQGVWDIEGNGTVIERKPFWYPKAESDEYWRLRFRAEQWRDA